MVPIRIDTYLDAKIDREIIEDSIRKQASIPEYFVSDFIHDGQQRAFYWFRISTACQYLTLSAGASFSCSRVCRQLRLWPHVCECVFPDV